MKITKTYLRIESLSATPIEQFVIEELLRRFDDYNDIADYVNEILTHGCISGIVGSLIYYHDTLSFFARYRTYINLLVSDLIYETGIFRMEDLFRTWDITDPLALETHNQNLLAWFGFESTLASLYEKWYRDLEDKDE